MDPKSAEFVPLFDQLRGAVLAHAEAEEADEFPGLRSSTSESERRIMAMALRAAEAIAPTHPHVNVTSAVANVALGPLASVIDHTRDAVREVLERAQRDEQADRDARQPLH